MKIDVPLCRSPSVIDWKPLGGQSVQGFLFVWALEKQVNFNLLDGTIELMFHSTHPLTVTAVSSPDKELPPRPLSQSLAIILHVVEDSDIVRVRNRSAVTERYI